MGDCREIRMTMGANLRSPTSLCDKEDCLLVDVPLPGHGYPTPPRGLHRPHLLPPTPCSAAYTPPSHCSRHIRHQISNFGPLAKMLACEGYQAGGAADALPVVELRPFTHKEWRPAKSVPGVIPVRGVGGPTQGHSHAPQPTGYDAASSLGYPNPDRQTSTSPRVRNKFPCPKASAVGGERRLLHPPIREATFRDPAPAPTEGEPGTSPTPPDHPTGFVPSVERTKSTLDEVRSGHVAAKHFQLQRAKTDSDLRHQPQPQQRRRRILIHGKSLEHPAAPREESITHYYRTIRNRGYPGSPSEGNGQPKIRSRFDDSIYDCFDRSRTLPSIRVGRTELRRRRAVDPEPAGSGRPCYQLGVTNSLDLMTQMGKPAGVEHHICLELKTSLEELRKHTRGGSNRAAGGGDRLLAQQGDSRFQSSFASQASLGPGSRVTPRLGPTEPRGPHPRRTNMGQEPPDDNSMDLACASLDKKRGLVGPPGRRSSERIGGQRLQTSAPGCQTASGSHRPEVNNLARGNRKHASASGSYNVSVPGDDSRKQSPPADDVTVRDNRVRISALIPTDTNQRIRQPVDPEDEAARVGDDQAASNPRTVRMDVNCSGAVTVATAQNANTHTAPTERHLHGGDVTGNDDTGDHGNLDDSEEEDQWPGACADSGLPPVVNGSTARVSARESPGADEESRVNGDEQECDLGVSVLMPAYQVMQ